MEEDLKNEDETKNEDDNKNHEIQKGLLTGCPKWHIFGKIWNIKTQHH